MDKKDRVILGSFYCLFCLILCFVVVARRSSEKTVLSTYLPETMVYTVLAIMCFINSILFFMNQENVVYTVLFCIIPVLIYIAILILGWNATLSSEIKQQLVGSTSSRRTLFCFIVLWTATLAVLWKGMEEDQKRDCLFYMGWSLLAFALIVLPWLRLRVLPNASPSYGNSQWMAIFFFIATVTTFRLSYEYSSCGDV